MQQEHLHRDIASALRVAVRDERTQERRGRSHEQAVRLHCSAIIAAKGHVDELALLPHVLHAPAVLPKQRHRRLFRLDFQDL